MEASTDMLQHNSKPAASSSDEPTFTLKAITILSFNSPFFDALWPVIFDVADPTTERNLGRTCLYFRGMAKREEARATSTKIKSRYIARMKHKLARLPPNPLKLDPHSELPLWYEWSADKSDFNSVNNFEDFCCHADVQLADGVVYSTIPGSDFMQTSFTSSTGDVNFVCGNDPRENDQMGYVHSFGCTGEREKALKLQSWFEENCQWAEISLGGREFI